MVDIAVWAPVVGALGGVSGLAAAVRIWSERHARNQDLAISLNTTARDWVDYIDSKFDKVAAEIETMKLDRRKRDQQRLIIHRAHRSWDINTKHALEKALGEQVADPPPLDLPLDEE